MEVNDYISRADARSLICKIDQKHHMSGMSWKAFKDLYNGIDDIPSVTPQEPVKKLEKQIKQLQNRCHALTHGQICVFCPYECEHKAEVRDKE